MNQGKEILKYLETGRALTPLDALSKFGCFRLAARIYTLRKEGKVILTDNVKKNGKTYARYRLIDE